MSRLIVLAVAGAAVLTLAACGSSGSVTSPASAISWADRQGSIINNEAKQLATTAQNYACAHSC